MARPITFTANIRGIVTAIEQAKTNIQDAKQEGFKQIANAAFGQVGSKWIVKGTHAQPKKNGKLEFLTPPGANINSVKTKFFNPKTKFKVQVAVPMFVKGKFVSRSGNYEKIMNDLACAKYANGVNVVSGVKVDIQPTSLRIYADDQSEVFKLEMHKQQGKTKVSPVTKAFRSAVSIWKRVRIKLGH